MNMILLSQKLCRGLVIGSLMLFSVSGRSLAGIYELKIHDMDVAGGVVGCQRLIERGAASFAAASGATVIGSECREDQLLNRVSGRIVYSAAESILPWSTHRHRTLDVGFFAQREACEAALATEVELMRRLTGLEPYLAFCYRLWQVGAPSYSTRIEAVGTSPVHKFSTGVVLDHRLQNPVAVATLLEEQARQIGLYPLYSFSGVVSVSPGFAMDFYGDRELFAHQRLNSLGSRYFPTLAQCEAAAAAFAAHASEPWDGVKACSFAHETLGFQLNLIWWNANQAGPVRIQAMLVPGSFESIEACDAAAGHTVAQVRNGGAHVIGSICGRSRSSTSPISLEVFSKI
jgi:hypothetical protein